MLEANPDCHILIQTDQIQARDEMLIALPNAIVLKNMPVTRRSVAVHNLDVQQEFGISRSELAIRLLAMTVLMSRMKFVVSHTGNLSAWIAIYRGRPDGFYQFDSEGKLRDPLGRTTDRDDLSAALTMEPPTAVPEGFDPSVYLELNRDVERAGFDGATHYLHYGWKEGRPWKRT